MTENLMTPVAAWGSAAGDETRMAYLPVAEVVPRPRTVTVTGWWGLPARTGVVAAARWAGARR